MELGGPIGDPEPQLSIADPEPHILTCCITELKTATSKGHHTLLPHYNLDTLLCNYDYKRRAIRFKSTYTSPLWR